MSYQAKLIKGGKIVIPAELRREMGFKEGDSLIFESDGDHVVLKSYRQVVREVQASVKAALKKPFTVDDYLAEKWAEADRE
ncbi:MAG TPA: AbrB/MazE/SpoVT family DNA-binding domain-containing protein [Novosphingobium sp.]|nr:AbrB/MazE/SpoVT family DNA-binding domain-containing protein [Novosphingobium sp.]